MARLFISQSTLNKESRDNLVREMRLIGQSVRWMKA